MKRALTLLLALAFSLAGLNASGLKASAADVAAGTIIKGKNLSSLYYVAEDGKRYVFPNEKTYFSWYENFSTVVEVDMEDLYNYPLGGNVRYKPGQVLIKIDTDPKVYAIGQNGQLRWVKNENLAKKLYGANWNLLVDDVPDSFFTNYRVAAAIEDEEEYDPEQEAEEVPTPSHNLGFKNRLQKQVQETVMERRCLRLEALITRVQNRLARFGLEAEELGADYLEQCFSQDNEDKTAHRWRWHNAGRINVCHQSDDGSAPRTLSVNLNAAKAHLAHGDTLGTCGTEPEEEEEEVDVTAPVISNIKIATSSESATITWNTDKNTNGKVYYDLFESMNSANLLEAVDTNSNSSSHSVVLNNLATSTTYYFYVESEDSSGNSASSSVANFKIEE